MIGVAFMKYLKNEEMEFIGVEDSMAIFNPLTGDTIVLDEIGVSIVKHLDNPLSLNELVTKLCIEYMPDDSNAMEDDVNSFIKQLCEQNVLKEIA